MTVGRVGRPHGLDGSFFVERPSDDPRRLRRGATVWVGGEPVQVVASKHGAGGRPVIRLDRPVERGAELTVPVSELPPPADGGFYVFRLIGLEVVDEAGEVLGRVQDVSPGIANDVIELDTRLALPMHEDCVLDVDLDAGRIVVASGFSGRG